MVLLFSSDEVGYTAWRSLCHGHLYNTSALYRCLLEWNARSYGREIKDRTLNSIQAENMIYKHLYGSVIYSHSQYLRYATSISLTIKLSWNIFALHEFLFLVAQMRVRGIISRGVGATYRKLCIMNLKILTYTQLLLEYPTLSSAPSSPSDTEIFIVLLNLHQPHHNTIRKKE